MPEPLQECHPWYKAPPCPTLAMLGFYCYCTRSIFEAKLQKKHKIYFIYEKKLFGVIVIQIIELVTIADWPLFKLPIA